MGTGKGGIAKLIERLEQKGLVRREADPQDSRSKRVYLGERIKPLTQEMGREIDDLVTSSLRELEDSEVVVLKRWLGTIRTNLLEEKDRKE
ncbi:transcriptional regulator SlyA [compost metagenome]